MEVRVADYTHQETRMTEPRIVVMPADQYGCGWYRLMFAANVLGHQGHQIMVIDPPQGKNFLRGIPDPRDGSLYDAHVPANADVVVLQRITHAAVVEAIKKWRDRGIAVVIDIDDDLDRIDPRNPAWAMLHPKGGSGQSWLTAEAACAAATLVTVSTPALLEKYAPRGNGVVLPNCVPSSYFEIPRFDSPVFGWPGSLHSHPSDLQVMGDAVGRLMREGHQFRIVGPGDGVREALRLPAEPDVTGPLPIQQYAYGVSTLGVGLAPLADTIFNRAKSRLKTLEQASVGVPTVFSPMPDYMALHKDSGGRIGIPAKNPREFYRLLKKLMDDEWFRRECSQAHREAAAEYTVDRHAWRWHEAWTHAFTLERKAASARSPFGWTRPPRIAGQEIPHAVQI